MTKTKKTKSVLIRNMSTELHAKLTKEGQRERIGKAGEKYKTRLNGEILNRLERSFEE